METIKSKLEGMLTERGLSTEQASEVMKDAIPKMKDIVKGYNIDFNDCSSDYPEGVYNALFMSVRSIAREWIAENKPQAWFRPMFEN